MLGKQGQALDPAGRRFGGNSKRCGQRLGLKNSCPTSKPGTFLLPYGVLGGLQIVRRAMGVASVR
jgi:hypothetical protein